MAAGRFVAHREYRQPSPASNKVSCAPGCGRSRRAKTRIAEAGREGWLGEVEGLKVSLAGAEDKLAQIDAALQRQATTVQLGMPAFPGIVPHSILTDH